MRRPQSPIRFHLPQGRGYDRESMPVPVRGMLREAALSALLSTVNPAVFAPVDTGVKMIATEQSRQREWRVTAFGKDWDRRGPQ